MKKVFHKLFWSWDYDKEEKWLNSMAEKGLCLSSVGFCRYVFKECLPGEYTFRLEMLENDPTHEESQRYIAFLEETGIEYVSSYLRWIYLKKKTAEGALELFSDYNSKIKHLNRILLLLGSVGGVNLYIGIQNLIKLFNFHGMGFTLGLVNLAIGLLLAFGCFKILFTKRKLKKEQQVFE